MTRSVEQNSAEGKARSHEAGAGTVSRPMTGANAGSTPAPRLPSVEGMFQLHGHLVVETTGELYWQIFNTHVRNLKVFASFSDPSGTFQGGDGTRGRMESVWGLDQADIPLIACRTFWDIPSGNQYGRNNERSSYYLVVARKEVES